MEQPGYPSDSDTLHYWHPGNYRWPLPSDPTYCWPSAPAKPLAYNTQDDKAIMHRPRKTGNSVRTDPWTVNSDRPSGPQIHYKHYPAGHSHLNNAAHPIEIRVHN